MGVIGRDQLGAEKSFECEEDRKRKAVSNSFFQCSDRCVSVVQSSGGRVSKLMSE